MRKLNLVAVLVLCLALVGAAIAAVKDVPIKVELNGKAQNIRPSAVLHAGKAYLPLNATAKLVNAGVKYDTSKKAYIIKSGKKTSTVKASQGAKIGGEMMFPVDVMAKSLDAQVKWISKSKTVAIKTSGKAGGDKKNCPPGG